MHDHQELENLSKQDQVDFLISWFRQHYDIPENHLPLDDESETGWAWIYGGPHHVYDIIRDEFSDVVDESVLKEVIDTLVGEATNWVCLEEVAETDREAHLEAVLANKSPEVTVLKALAETEKLLKQNTNQYFHRLLLAGVVATLEVFFLDYFVQAIRDDKERLRKFVECDTNFGQRTITISDIFKRFDKLEVEAQEYLTGLLWHNLGQVVGLYRGVFGIKLSEKHKDVIGKAIVLRHDILHRGGKTKKGEELNVTPDYISVVIRAARGVVGEICSQRRTDF